MTVPTEWGKVFHGNNGKDYVSISIPVPENGDNFKYYSFIIPSERFRESDRQPGNSYFGFPKLKKGSEEEYTIQLKRSEKQEDGSYIDVKKEISSAELKGHVEAALKRAAEKEQQTEETHNKEKGAAKEEPGKEDDPFMTAPLDEEMPFMEPANEEKQQQARPAGRHGR